MKKRITLFLIAVTLYSASAVAQLVGDGSIANPYHGFLNGNFTIIGTKYFDGNIYVDNEKLIVAPGARLVALQMRASIFVTNSGQIEVAGTSISPVLFTSDLDRDGIFGEPTDQWGNITVTSTAASTISFAIFERGLKNFFKFGTLGGGLRIETSSLSVTACTFRNCLANRGGAIAVLSGSAPVISRCTFLTNSAVEQGGAIYVEAGSSPLISNCVFNGNSSTSLTLKGGTVASISSSPVIVNSTLVYSSAGVSDGTSVYLENSPGARIVNTIVWGGSNLIGLSNTPSTVFSHSAIQGATYPGNITLNSNNAAADGPNFINPAGGNLTLDFVSPLRDTGADTYPGITVPTTDINAKGRVYITDLGAYEMVYSRWNGNISTAWGFPKNWERSYLPGSTNIVIPGGLANYPVIAPGPSFTLNAGLRMIMLPGSRATFASLTNNGVLDLRADATGMASLITGSYNGAGGSAKSEIYVTGGDIIPEEVGRWHYIAAPATVPKSVITDIDPYNLMRYDETEVTTATAEGWQWHDGWDGTTGFSTLDPGRGYNISFAMDTTIVFNGLTSLTTSLGQINLPFSGSGGDTSLYGYYVVGNSLTCGINWDLVTRSNTTYVRNAIYITKDDYVASYVNGVGTNGGSAHIPPLQGFFVKTRATGTYITIPDNAREHNSTLRYKSAQNIPLIRLELSSARGRDETVIRLDRQATAGFDNELDAEKFFAPRERNPLLYSVMNGENYSINSVSWPKSQTVIPLTLQIPAEGTYTLKRSQLQALGGTKVTLTDMLSGKTVDLQAVSDYTFSASAGTVADRFLLTLIATAPEIKKQDAAPSSLKIYASANKICVLPSGSEWNDIRGRVRVFDITGSVILAGNEEMFNAGELKEYYPGGSGGMLIVEISAGGKRYLEKLVMTR
jgi:predicted outer membrane repeat protein